MVILAAILDLRTPIEIYMTFDCFNGSAMVKNLYIDGNVFTLGAFLSEIEPFYWCLFWPGGHLGCHFGCHFEFTGHNFTIHVFWLFQVVDQRQEHIPIPRCYYFYSKCIFKWDRAILMFPGLTRTMVILAAISIWIWGLPLRFTWLLTVSMDPPWSITYA